MKFIAMIALLSGMTGTVMASGLESFCHDAGDVNEKVCDVSVSILAANPAFFDGRLVTFTGYFANAKVPVVFMGKDSAMHSIVADGIALKLPADPRLKDRLLQLNHNYLTVFGRFSALGETTVDVTGYRTAGRIIDVKQVGVSAGPWGYAEEVAPIQ